MALIKLTIPPDQPGYSAKDGIETISVKLDGGAPRSRRDILNASRTVSVKWSVGPGNYRYLRAFYNSVSKSASLPFLMDLYLDEPELTTHEVRFVPGSFGLTGQSGLTFYVAAQLEVTPIAVNEEYDQSLVDLVNAYGSFEAAQAFLDRLAIFANQDLPDNLG